MELGIYDNVLHSFYEDILASEFRSEAKKLTTTEGTSPS